jgi:hypothetical protein
VSFQAFKGAALNCPLPAYLAASEEFIGQHLTDPARAHLQILSRLNDTYNIHDITIPLPV